MHVLDQLCYGMSYESYSITHELYHHGLGPLLKATGYGYGKVTNIMVVES